MTAQDTQIHSQQDGSRCISVHDDGANRWLEFGDGGIQSIIDPQHPRTLISPVAQSMLAALLFTPFPTNVLLLGVGGGAIARFLAQRHPDCQGDAVEISPAIINIARQFFDFPEHHWQLHQADARDFMSEKKPLNSAHAYDYIVLDIAEQQHTPLWVTEAPFLGQCRQQLSSKGVLCINFAPRDADEFKLQLAQTRQAFNARTLCLSVPAYRNVLVFAFAQNPAFDDMAQLHQRANDLHQYWELPFNDCLSRMVHENPVGSGIF